MNCPNCGGSLYLEDGKDHLRCDYCSQLFFPEPNADGVRVLGEHASLNCPVCLTPLVHAAVSKHRLLYCESCRGILVSMETFVDLVPELRAHYAEHPERAPAMNPIDLERALGCPQCLHRMDTHPYGGPGNIVIDNCPGCKLNWLDYRELRRIASAPDACNAPGAWQMPE